MKSMTRVELIGKDSISMDEPKFLPEAKREEAHEEVLKRLLSKESKVSYNEIEKRLSSTDGKLIQALASPIAITTAKNTGEVVIYDVPGYSLCFLPETINDFQKEFLTIRYLTSDELLMGYYLDDGKIYEIDEAEAKNHSLFHEILENQYQKGNRL